MAKAKYHKSQRVFVRPVGTWAYVEQIVPKWVRGSDEPDRILYDCGMGREFKEEELEDESVALKGKPKFDSIEANWRVLRGQNRWKTAEQCPHHPYPGTHPVIVTGKDNWGGWRVPGAEYDKDPYIVEKQAQLMSNAPMFLALLKNFVSQAEEDPENFSSPLLKLAELSRRVIDQLGD